MRNFYLLLLVLLLNSCRKSQKLPTQNLDINLISIMKLKKLYIKAGTFKKINQNLKITGTVIANDQYNNLYQKIIIQDNSGGIAINIDAHNLYTNYPIGQKVTVLCKDLTLSDYANSISLGLDKSENPQNPQLLPIPTAIIDKYIQKESLGPKITPRTVKINHLSTALHDPYQNTLIKLEGIEAQKEDIGKTLADPLKLYSALSYKLLDCRRQEILLRTSSYSKIATAKLTGGNGSIVGIFNPYVRNNSNEKVITLLKIEDLQLNGARCTFNPQRKSLAEIRQYPQHEIFPADWYIEAVVISNSKNESQLNYVLQDETAGITVRFDKITQEPKWKLNEKVRLNLELLKLSMYNGNLQISEIPKQNVPKIDNINQNIPKFKGYEIANLHTKINYDPVLSHTLVALTNVKITKYRSISFSKNNRQDKTQKITCYSITNYNNSPTLNYKPSWQDTIYTCIREEANKDIPIESYLKGNIKIDSIKGYVDIYQGKAQIHLRSKNDIIVSTSSNKAAKASTKKRTKKTKKTKK